MYPLDGGSGPFKSMWMTLKRASGLGKVDSREVVCPWTFAHWHCMHALVHLRTSVLIPGQTNREVMSF